MRAPSISGRVRRYATAARMSSAKSADVAVERPGVRSVHTAIVETQHRNSATTKRVRQLAKRTIVPRAPPSARRDPAEPEPVIVTTAGARPPTRPRGIVSVPVSRRPAGVRTTTSSAVYGASRGAAYRSGAVSCTSATRTQSDVLRRHDAAEQSPRGRDGNTRRDVAEVDRRRVAADERHREWRRLSDGRDEDRVEHHLLIRTERARVKHDLLHERDEPFTNIIAPGALGMCTGPAPMSAITLSPSNTQRRTFADRVAGRREDARLHLTHEPVGRQRRAIDDARSAHAIENLARQRGGRPLTPLGEDRVLPRHHVERGALGAVCAPRSAGATSASHGSRLMMSRDHP